MTIEQISQALNSASGMIKPVYEHLQAMPATATEPSDMKLLRSQIVDIDHKLTTASYLAHDLHHG